MLCHNHVQLIPELFLAHTHTSWTNDCFVFNPALMMTSACDILNIFLYNQVLLIVLFVWVIAWHVFLVDCTYTGSLFQWYSCSLDTCQTHLITVRMSATCGFMELAGLAQLDDQNSHSKPEQFLTTASHSQFVDKLLVSSFCVFCNPCETTLTFIVSWHIYIFAHAFVSHQICLCIALDCNTILYCCCTNDDLRSSSLAVTFNTFEVQAKIHISHAWLIALVSSPCLYPVWFIPSRPCRYDQV